MKNISRKKGLKLSVILIIMIIALFALSACGTSTGNKNGTGTNQTGQTGTTNNLTGAKTAGPYTLYFASATNANQLMPVTRTYTKDYGTDVVGQAREMMTALVSGPTETAALATLPATAEVNNVDLSPDGTMTVDFSKFDTSRTALGTTNTTNTTNTTGTTGNTGTTGTISTISGKTTVYSIVNSLTNLPGVDKVVLKLNGKTFKVMDEEYAEALTRNETLIGEVPGRTGTTTGTGITGTTGTTK